MTKSTKIAWSVLLLASAGIIVMRRRQKDVRPSLLNDQYDMSKYTVLPRGYRNNNPLNIRRSSANEWDGKITPNTDGVFEQFRSMPYGYRAAFKLIRNYIAAGYTTIAAIIARWAPANENNTNKYMNDVCAIMSERTGRNVTPFDAVQPSDADTLCNMAYAMSIIENGQTVATRAAGLPNMDIIRQGYRLL